MSEWQKLKDVVVKIVGGGTPSRKKEEYYHGDIPWVTVKDLIATSISNAQEKITPQAIQESAANLIPKGNVIIATRMALGKAFINEVDVAINQDLKALVPNKEKVIPKYLLYTYLSNKEKIEGLGSGTTVKGVRLEQVNELEVFVPSLEEQKKIIAILSSVDNAIEKTESIIEQTEKVKKGLMQQLLTKGIGHTEFKKTDFGDIPEDWELVSLNDIILSLDAGVSVNSENRDKNHDEKGILKTSAVTTRIFNPKEHKTILPHEVVRAKISPKKGNIIVSRMNTKELVGASSYIDRDYEELFLPDRLWQAMLDESKVLSIWLSFVLTSPIMRNRISEIATGTSGSMKNISKKAFLELKIALPNKVEQEKIADMLNAIDKKQLKEKEKFVQLQTLKQGLMQSLLTGEVRVKVDETEEVTQV